MKTFFKILGIIVLLGGFGYVMYFLWDKSQEEPVVYETQSPITTTIVNKTVATGSVVPRKEIEIKPQVSGIIDELFVEEGDEIKKGDLMARIRIIPNMINLNNAESRVTKSKIAMQDAKRNFDRMVDLYKKGVIAKKEFESYEIAYDNAKEELQNAEDNLALIKEGQLKKSGAPTNTLVRSTISGMVLDIPVEIGNSVIESNNFNDGTTIATVADMGDMIFKGKIDETEVGKIHVGMPLILTIGAIDETKFDATLTKISPKGVEENGAVQFEIEADVNLKRDEFIRSGYSANADIVLDKVEDVLAIPEALLQFEDDKTFVEVETGDQKFEKTYITTGLSDGINIQIKGGIDKDAKIKKPV
jgi:HlyD family secretion protein